MPASQTITRLPFAFLMTTLHGVPFALAAHADTAPTYSPASTTVAILPVENLSKGKDGSMKAKQSDRGLQDISAAFTQRGFRLADPRVVGKALQDSRLDLRSDASRTPANLAGLGASSGADLVVLMVITDTNQGYRHSFFFTAQREGEAKTKLWLVDTRTQSAVLDGIAKSGKSRANMGVALLVGGIGSGSSTYVLKAVDDDVTRSLEDFLKPYPVTSPAQSTEIAKAPAPALTPAATPPRVVSIAAPTPAAAPSPAQSLFTFQNGAQTVGTLLSFDGTTYTVSTPKGPRHFRAAGIKSIQALPSMPVVADQK